MVKRVFAVLCVMVVVALSTVPCFAETWDEVTPQYAIYLNSPTMQSTSKPLADEITALVDQAYKMGMFGGAKPSAVMYNYVGYNSGFYIEVAVPTFLVNVNTYDKINGFSVVAYNDTNFTVYGRGGGYKRSAIWRLAENGDWYIVDLTQSNGTVALSNAEPLAAPANSRKLVAYANTNGDGWFAGSTLFRTEYTAGNDNGTSGSNPAISQIAELYEGQIDYLEGRGPAYEIGYEEGYRQGFANGSPNLLNIPSIFDSMFDGVQAIMTAFDVELFGISIIGTLVAVLVIAIIAFVVRKLWK